MGFQKVCLTLLPLFPLVACRPVSSGKVHESGTGPIGLAAAIDVSDAGNGFFKISCLDGSTGSHTKSEIQSNSVCEKKSTTTSSAGNDTTSTTAAGSLTLYFGTLSYIKTNPVDCTAGGNCVENQTSCQINVNGSPVALKVNSVAAASTRSYDHIIAQRTASTACKLSNVYVYFPHLIVSLKFALDTPVNSSCVLPAGTVLEGAIQRNPSGKIFNFLVSKGSGCAATGASLTGMNFDSLAAPSTLVRTILGQ